MPRNFVTPGLAATALLFAVGLRAADPDGPSLTKMWDLASRSQPLEARTMLDDLPGVDARTRELAELALDMARPPLSEGDWNRIEPRLAKLAAGDDEVAARALYLQARMHQIQRTPPDYPRAEELYRELARRWPGSHWAQLGTVKLGLVKLYALPEPADPAARIAAVAALLPAMAEPALRRDLELQIGWAGVHYRRPYDEILPHLIAADKIGGLLGITPEDLVIQIGELSFRAGHLAQAKHYFERFLTEFPTNTRRYNVQRRLDDVNAALAKEDAP